MSETQTPKKIQGSQPTQLSLLAHMTYSPGVEPRRENTQLVDVIRQDEQGRDVLVQTKFTIRMPDETETLPMIHNRQVLDVLVRDLVRLGIPSDDTIPFSPTAVLRDLGLSDGGENYKTVYETINKYWRMEITFSDTAPVPVKKTRTLPYLTGVRVISAFNIPKPGRDGKADGNNGWVRFERWFTDGLRDKSERKYLSAAVLSSFKIGEHRRIYEVIKKFMGSKPIFEIGIDKLRKWIPYDEDLDMKEYVRKTKRALEHLKKVGAFPKIEIRGRGKGTIITFYNTSSESRVEAKRIGEDEKGDIAGPITRILAELKELMSKEAISEGRAGATSFKKDLNATEAVFVALLEKWSPDESLLHEALAETRAALREGRIKTTVRQFFVDTLGRYTGKK